MFARTVPASSSAIPAHRRHRAVGLGLAAFLAHASFGIAVASPSLEYGPEAEAGFLEHCMANMPIRSSHAACQRMMERIQAEHGYAAFVEAAAGGPAAFGGQAVASGVDLRIAEAQSVDAASR